MGARCPLLAEKQTSVCVASMSALEVKRAEALVPRQWHCRGPWYAYIAGFWRELIK